jgi:hypothetical protein
VKRAKIYISHNKLRDVLDLADDVEIIGVDVVQDPLSLSVRVVSGRVPDNKVEARSDESWFIPLDKFQNTE